MPVSSGGFTRAIKSQTWIASFLIFLFLSISSGVSYARTIRKRWDRVAPSQTRARTLNGGRHNSQRYCNHRSTVWGTIFGIAHPPTRSCCWTGRLLISSTSSSPRARQKYKLERKRSISVTLRKYCGQRKTVKTLCWMNNLRTSSLIYRGISDFCPDASWCGLWCCFDNSELMEGPSNAVWCGE